MKILVTAGPTREPLDPVRFISNRSSGKMGYAIARAALKHCHEVALISGPVHIRAPVGARLVHVVTAEDMLRAVRDNISWCDALVMAAAVADWRPKKQRAHKLKKFRGAPVIEWVRTADILENVQKLKGKRLFVGFAAETRNLLGEARRKLAAKSLDLIVANDVSRADAGFEVDDNKVTFISANACVEDIPLMSKDAVAARIIDWVEHQSGGISRQWRSSFERTLSRVPPPH